MWTKIKERERERESKPQTQGCTTWKKKRESKPPKNHGDPENMDQEKIGKRRNPNPKQKWKTNTSLAHIRGPRINPQKKKKKNPRNVFLETKKNPNTWPCI
jgi:hypothetical protein